MANSHQPNLDQRVSMLAEAVKSAITGDPKQTSGPRTAVVGRGWSTLRKKFLTNQQRAKTGSTASGLDASESSLQNNMKKGPWVAFGSGLPMERTTDSPTYSVPTMSIGTPPPPPPPPPLANVMLSQAASDNGDAGNSSGQPTSSATQLGEVDVGDDPWLSIGTQTDQLVKAPSKPKTPKMKTKSLQIDIPESGKLQHSTSIFSRTRSITPTRYRASKVEEKMKENTRAGSLDGHRKKTSGKGNIRRKAKRSQSLSPAKRKQSHKLRDTKNHTQATVKVMKPRVQAQKKEIVARVTNVEKELSDVKKVRPKAKTKQPTNKETGEKIKSNDSKSESRRNKKVKNYSKSKEKGEKPRQSKKQVAKKKTMAKKEMDDNLDRKSADEKESIYSNGKLREIEEVKNVRGNEEDSEDVPSATESPPGDIHSPNDKQPNSLEVVESTHSSPNKLADSFEDKEEDKISIASEEPSVAQHGGDDKMVDIADKISAAEIVVEKAGDAKSNADIELGERLELVEDEFNANKDLNEDEEIDAEMPYGEMDYLEDIIAAAKDDESNLAGLDPELVKRTEDQIFAKIKFYKGVLDGVKNKPWTLRKKMKLLKEAREYTAKFEGKLSKSGGPDQLLRLKTAYSKTMRELSNLASLLVPWEGRIKHIESYFGSVVASYFTFLRWIFWTNIVQAVIIGGVIMAPEVIFGPEWGTKDYKSVPVNETKTAAYLTTAWNFEGYLKYSPLFYGYYSNTKRFESGYRMPLAYLIGNLATFAYSFIAILRQIAANAKDEKASDKDDNFTFSWKTFANWDYMIGNSETAKNKFKSIVIAIRESITEQKEAKKKIGKKLKALRILANFLVLIVLGGSTYAIYLTVDRSRQFEEKVKKEGPDSVNAWQRNEVSVVMSLVTAFFPMLFDIIANLEDYHPRVALQWSLYRILTLYLLNLYTLYIALYWKIQDIQNTADKANSTYYAQFNMSTAVFCNDVNYETSSTVEANSSLISPAVNNETCIEKFISETTCWETMVGQELFKLTMFDMVTTIALIYAVEFFRAVAIKVLNACWCWDLERNLPGYATFSLAENLLHLVYNQGMIWMGTLFSPGLPAFNLIKLLVLFYVRAWAVMVSNVPEERIFKAGSNNFYLLILLFMLYVVMIPIAFAMVTIRTSKICGPFRDLQFMYLALTDWMEETLPSVVNTVLAYLSSPGALIPIFILLFLILNYLKSSNEALKGAVQDLKKQLNYERTEGKKKVFTMADGGGKAKQEKAKAKQEEDIKLSDGRSMGGRSSWMAIQALHRMGGLKNGKGPPSVASTKSGQVSIAEANKPSLGATLTAANFLARMKSRANHTRNTVTHPSA